MDSASRANEQPDNVTATVTGGIDAGLEPGVDATPGDQAPPTYIRPKFDRMPPELKSLKNWLMWGAVWNGSKWTKRPITVSGYGASSTVPKHWSTFDEVKQAYEQAAPCCLGIGKWRSWKYLSIRWALFQGDEPRRTSRLSTQSPFMGRAGCTVSANNSDRAYIREWS